MTTATSTAATVVLVPGDRFFVRAVPVDAATPVAAQVELALEESSPFPLAQLYHGYVAGGDGRLALAYAAYRRRFTAEEQAAWAAVDAVVPSLVALLGPVPTQPAVVIHADGEALQGVAWDGRGQSPVAVVARAVIGAPDAAIAELAAELRRACGAGEGAVRQLAGPITAEPADDGGAVFRIGGTETLQLSAAALAAADVRDKSFLEEKQRAGREDRRWWRIALLGLGALGLALVLELANFGLGLWVRQQRAQLAQHADEVRRIEAAQTMALRIENLAARQQRPLEWLAAASAARPRSVQFTRVLGHNNRTLDIEAQTPNANDVGNYEAALRQLPALERAEMHDLRAREGLTTFVVTLTFKPAAPAATEARP